MYTVDVFKGHKLEAQGKRDRYPLQSDEISPTPDYINDVYKQTARANSKPKGHRETTKYDMFVNAQWAIGGEGTGAPIHFHNSAWSALVYGTKVSLFYLLLL